MTRLPQSVHGLLGAEEDIASLAALPSARILAISDSHGARDILLAAINAKGKECDALVFCGDGVSDLLYCVGSALCDDATAFSLPPVIAFVRGNNDYGNYSAVFDEHSLITAPNRQVLQAAGHTIFITHGHREGVRPHCPSSLMSEANMAGADTVLFGHTHVAEADDMCINPGSLKYPRNGGAPSFAVLDMRKKGGVDVTFFGVEASLSGLVCSAFVPEKAALWR